MLTIKNLKKTYPGGIQALKGVSLEIPTGIFGLLGPNGAGKTTLMKILATLLEPDEGQIWFGDLDLISEKERARELTGYLPQDFGLYPSLTAGQMLDYIACLKGVTDKRHRDRLVDELLEKVNLHQYKHQKLGSFSGGMRQRFGIAQALIGHPRLLIIDEPTAGLDPEERLRFHNLLGQLSVGMVVILSTHIVSDVSSLCSRMAIIQAGRIVVNTTPSEAMARLEGRLWQASAERNGSENWVRHLNVVSVSPAENGRVRIKVLTAGEKPAEGFSLVQPTLDDVYFSFVGAIANREGDVTEAG